MRLATTMEGNELTLYLDGASIRDFRGFEHAVRFLFGEPEEMRAKGPGHDAPFRVGHRHLILGGSQDGDTIDPKGVKVLTIRLGDGTQIKYLELDALVDLALEEQVLTVGEAVAALENDYIAGRITAEQRDALVQKAKGWKE